MTFTHPAQADCTSPAGVAGGITWNGTDSVIWCDGSVWHSLLTGGGSGITDLTGDVTATGPGSAAATIAASAVTTSKINNSAVTTAKVADANISYAKIQNISGNNRLLGRATAGSGVVEEITLGTGLSLSGTTLNAAAGAAAAGSTGQIQYNNANALAASSTFAVGVTNYTCPANYALSGTGCYRIISTVKTYSNALSDCQSDGGTLTKISDAAENAAIYSMITANSWIGANDIVTEGTFLWQDSSALSYTNWASGEPNNSGGVQDCALMYASSNPGKWDDDTCTSTRTAICEAAPGAGTTATSVSVPALKLLPTGGLPGTCAVGSSSVGLMVLYQDRIYVCSYDDNYGTYGWRKLYTN